MQDTTVSILGTGWLGLPLAQHLLSQGYTVKGSTTTPSKIATLQAAGIVPYLLEVDDRIAGEAGEDFFDADVLIVTIPPQRDLAAFEQSIRAIAKHIERSRVSKVIYTSSTGVYGHVSGEVDETFPPLPDRATAQGVWLAERILREQTAADVTILRLAGLVGGNRKPGRFFAGRKNLPSGNAPVNLVHQEDCIAVIERIIEGEHWNEVFNLVADIHPPKRIFYDYQARKHNFERPQFAQDRKSGMEYKTVCNNKVKNALQYEFKHPDPMCF